MTGGTQALLDTSEEIKVVLVLVHVGQDFLLVDELASAEFAPRVHFGSRSALRELATA